MKAILFFAIICAVLSVEPEDAVVTIDAELLQTAIAKCIHVTPYFEKLSKYYKKKQYGKMLKTGIKIIEEGIPAVHNVMEAVTYKPENIEQNLRGNININFGGINLPCINICINFGHGQFGCNCK